MRQARPRPSDHVIAPDLKAVADVADIGARGQQQLARQLDVQGVKRRFAKKHLRGQRLQIRAALDVSLVVRQRFVQHVVHILKQPRPDPDGLGDLFQRQSANQGIARLDHQRDLGDLIGIEA